MSLFHWFESSSARDELDRSVSVLVLGERSRVGVVISVARDWVTSSLCAIEHWSVPVVWVVAFSCWSEFLRELNLLKLRRSNWAVGMNFLVILIACFEVSGSLPWLASSD